MFVPIPLSEKKRTYLINSKVKDYFVPHSHFFNRWIRIYSGSKSWGVRPDHFYQLKAPISILFILCLCYFETPWIIYIISITNPLCILVFLTIYPIFLNLPSNNLSCMVIHTNDSKNSIWLIFWARFKTGWLITQSWGKWIASSAYVYLRLTLVHRKWDSIFLLQTYKLFSFTHITIWFSSSTRIMNKKWRYIFNSFHLFPRKKGIGKLLCFNESHVEILITHIELMVFHN